ncbi:Kelch domain-containing protein 10 [Thelohanellus kitauei]|uniref:Kelch domain-containing protein 10 n=1 Tax=Thelohanellus kitauei TaxID=669202 RepID=A0A0C2IWB0_THEKT|nr:Kelch domain-containing protein 10 [Thelohanellus kitauei]
MDVVNAETSPSDRRGHGMTSINEFIILYGGYDYWSCAVRRELWTYNTICRVWKLYQPPMDVSKACFASSICAVDNLVYIFGGSCSPFASGSTNSIVSFDIFKENWQIIFPHMDDDDQSTPPPMHGSLIFYLDKSLYIFGGFRRNVKSDKIYKFCLNTLTWSLVTQNGPRPFLDHRIFGTVFENRLYTFGGAIPRTSRFRKVKIFDFINNTWVIKATKSKTQLYPSERTDESFEFSNNCGYMSGGMSSTQLYSDIWKIDLKTLEWTKLDYSLKSGVFSHCMSLVNYCYLYTFGGLGHHTDRPNAFQRFTIQPPKLYHICLEFISNSPRRRTYIKYLPRSIVDELPFSKDN